MEVPRAGIGHDADGSPSPSTSGAFVTWRARPRTSGRTPPNPHPGDCLRHYAITSSLRAGIPVHVVQRMAGHKHLATTQTYGLRNPSEPARMTRGTKPFRTDLIWQRFGTGTRPTNAIQVTVQKVSSSPSLRPGPTNGLDKPNRAFLANLHLPSPGERGLHCSTCPEKLAFSTGWMRSSSTMSSARCALRRLCLPHAFRGPSSPRKPARSSRDNSSPAVSSAARKRYAFPSRRRSRAFSKVARAFHSGTSESASRAAPRPRSTPPSPSSSAKDGRASWCEPRWRCWSGPPSVRSIQPRSHTSRRWPRRSSRPSRRFRRRACHARSCRKISRLSSHLSCPRFVFPLQRPTRRHPFSSTRPCAASKIRRSSSCASRISCAPCPAISRSTPFTKHSPRA
ncbi:site-specific integrase [Polyangium fumosum]|uniref:Site-specific integrase n=1 Tax=Polyangium fumosum TaxID=889272 RepID=A0A4U1IMH7_9BACT|nr:site-specific integrase [Polyangium fumosum]